MLDRHTELRIATAGITISALILFLWIPMDVDTAMIETFRRQTYLGDSFLPSLIAAGMLVCSIGQFVVSLRRKDSRSEDSTFDHVTLRFFTLLSAIIGISLALMFWAGPLAWDLLGDGERSYRQMRDTAPWKYVGFVLGGMAMVGGIITLIEGRLRSRTLVIAAGFILLLILIFDVPFDTILLPPNGDW
ncbi:hypothetical protein [Tritonibacter scottomollicae]|uniref:hypothetical protein n=1 Tax=Tritonibacter scottomollicae TaxID=483013 RepID=UPI003BA8E4C9